MKKKPHLVDLEILTGIAILLVVAGHLVSGSDKNSFGLEWYKYLKQLIYSFHMPLFMFISGFIMHYSFPGIKSSNEYFRYTKKKFIRLMPSYIIFAIIIYFSKIILGAWLMIDNPVKNYSSFFEAFYIPTASYAGFLWYIYVLFEYYLIIPIILKLIKDKVWILLLISIPLHFIKITDVLAVNFFFQMLFFFALGIFASKNIANYYKLIDSYNLLFLIAFIAIIVLFFYFKLPKILTGLTSIPALHGLVRRKVFRHNKLMQLIGQYSFAIYLMNTLTIGFFKAIGFKFLNWNYSDFIFPAIVLIILGTAVPILIKKYIFEKIPIFKYIG